MQHQVTVMLQKVEGGQASFEEDLFPLIYQELRRIAQGQLSREATGHTLQATALVNEYYLKMSDLERESLSWENRRHFFQAAARAMQNMLVDHARRKKSQKRGGNEVHVGLDKVDPAANTERVDLIALDEALTKLEQENERLAETVRLKFFANLTIREISDHLEVSHATVERDWTYAKSWLAVEMESA